MKVVCVNNKFYPVGGPPTKLPVIGEFYTVVKVRESVYKKGVIVYKISELDYNTWYHEKMFAALSDIDEKEFERNYNFQTV